MEKLFIVMLLVISTVILTAQVAFTRELLRVANSGDAEAQFWLGVIYQNGLGVEEDGAKALEWYRKAADQGNMGSVSEVGVK